MPSVGRATRPEAVELAEVGVRAAGEERVGRDVAQIVCGPDRPSAGRSPAPTRGRPAPDRRAPDHPVGAARSASWASASSVRCSASSSPHPSVAGVGDGPRQLRPGTRDRPAADRPAGDRGEARTGAFALPLRQSPAVTGHAEPDRRHAPFADRSPNVDPHDAVVFRGGEAASPDGVIVTFCQTRSPARIVKNPPRRGGYDCDLKEASVQLR